MAEDNYQDRPRPRRATPAALALPPWPWALPAVDPQLLARWLVRNAATELEERRLFPWIAVFFGIGILLFFQAETPALWAPVLGFGLTALAASRAQSRPAAMAALIAAAAVFAGFFAAALRTRAVEAPVIGKVTITRVSGFIEAVEHRKAGPRLVVRLVAAAGLSEAALPRRIRVTARERDGLQAGMFIEANARLLPPPEPAWPGGYDFARDAFYREIGAVGSLVGRASLSRRPAPDWQLAVSVRVDEARNALTERIATAVGGAAGGVAAALVTGKRGLIEEDTNDALRAAGIYHIVSISGLHMVLAAGTLFWVVRALLAAFPACALLWPIKKIAAVVGMAGAVAYCIFSGSEVATERSLVMALVMFGAILVDRPALSMRNCAIAALIVLAREPETLLGPSFQMSFAAVAALIASAPTLHFPEKEEGAQGFLARTGRRASHTVLNLLAATLVASLATAPFAAYHFQTLNPFGLIGNTLALPLVSLVVMPAAVLGTLAYPFGLDRPVWQVMGMAVAQVLDLSSWVSRFDGATIIVPALGLGALAMMSIALIVASLFASKLRWAAIMPACIGLALAANPERFDIFVDRTLAGAAIRGVDGRLVVVGKPSSFVVEQWLRADGDARSADDASLRSGARCDPGGCVVRHPSGHAIAFAGDLRSLTEDCTIASVVIAQIKAPAACRAALLDRALANASGAIAARFDGDALAIRSTRKNAVSQPLTTAPPTSRAPAPTTPAASRASPIRPALDVDPPEEPAATLDE